jgi:hypothetical protein
MLLRSPVVKESILARREDPPAKSTPAKSKSAKSGPADIAPAENTPAKSTPREAGLAKTSRARRRVDPAEGDGEVSRDRRSINMLQDVKDLGGRLWSFGLLLTGIVVDLSFMGVWLILHHLASDIFDHVGPASRISHMEKQIMEILFDAATLAILVAYVVRDLYLSVRRIWRSW